jgi:hypothetical protein
LWFARDRPHLCDLMVSLNIAALSEAGNIATLVAFESFVSRRLKRTELLERSGRRGGFEAERLALAAGFAVRPDALELGTFRLDFPL